MLWLRFFFDKKYNNDGVHWAYLHQTVAGEWPRMALLQNVLSRPGIVRRSRLFFRQDCYKGSIKKVTKCTGK